LFAQPTAGEDSQCGKGLAVPELTGPPAGAGGTKRREVPVPAARRVGSFVVWWVVLMSLWVLLDDSIALAELLAGAGAAALGAVLAELVQYQAATQFRMRVEWLVPALLLPSQVGRDLIIVSRALWRRLLHGEGPESAFRELPARFGDDSPEGVTRRALLVAGRSIAPNSFVLGLDRERGVMVVHQLVADEPPGRQ
jgi:multisubunit Na+/H+ antiporter MnhE subunit